MIFKEFLLRNIKREMLVALRFVDKMGLDSYNSEPQKDHQKRSFLAFPALDSLILMFPVITVTGNNRYIFIIIY